MRKGIESWKQILTSVLLNELFHTEYITRSYSFSLLFFSFFSIHLLFGRAMPRSRNQYSGVATLQGISNKCIDSRKHLSSASIFLSAVPENFCSIFLKCAAILRISLLLWSVLPSFQLLTLKAFLYWGGKRRNQYQKRTLRLIFRLMFPIFLPCYQ